MNDSSIIERAFQLARSGECGNLTELEKQLKLELYTNVHEHLSGTSIRKQLKQIFADSKNQKKSNSVD